MIKTGDFLHREKTTISNDVQLADSVFVTEEIMILNHIWDESPEDKKAVIKVIEVMIEKLNSVSPKNLKSLYFYNDEQLHKIKTKWKKAGTIKLGDSTYKLVNPVELTTLRARLMLKSHLLQIIDYKAEENLHNLQKGTLKIKVVTSQNAEMNFKPDWMDW